MRVGIGYDIHQFAEGRKLVLGGVEIPYIKGLEGHSDADVLLHAVCDALLGAAGESDIGKHFPNNDVTYKDISSIELLKEVNRIISSRKFSVNNIDSVILAEEPRIEPFREKMILNIASALNIDKSRINIKATTVERLGAIGRLEGISSYAVASLEENIK